jgi:molybdenum cofactor cytidylyltransferase
MKVVSAILLAAGESRRMGTENKLTLPVAGEPMLRRNAITLLDSRVHELVAVLGHARDTAHALLDDLPVRLVDNADWRDGQMTSVQRGMAALTEPCDGVMVCLADQPLLQVRDINALLEAFEDCKTSVLVPTWQGQRGNPIILDHRHRDTILAGQRNLGCRKLIDNNPELVTAWPMDNDHVVFDIDTPADYTRLRARLAAGEDSAARPAAAGGQ